MDVFTGGFGSYSEFPIQNLHKGKGVTVIQICRVKSALCNLILAHTE